MSIALSPLSKALGIEVKELQPDSLGESEKAELRQALLDSGVLLLRGLNLTPASQVAFTRIFGEPYVHPIKSIRLEDCPEIIVLGLNPQGTVKPDDPAANEMIGQIPWHADLMYTACPTPAALLHAVEVPPEGGQTGYLDAAVVYDALPVDLKQQLSGLRLVHSMAANQAALDRFNTAAYNGSNVEPLPGFPEVVHPLVHRHPTTGRAVLNISPAFAQHIVGMTAAKSDALLEELGDFATQDRFTYYHDWQVGDLVIWDNFRTMHIAAGHKKKYSRCMHRTTLSGNVALEPWVA